MPRRWRNAAANAGLLAASLCLAFALGEIIVRFQHDAWPFDYDIVSYPHMTAADRVLRWRFPPGEDRNSLGLRNREISEKGTDVFRILVLGDSLVYRGDTSSGHLWTELVERNLNAALSSSHRTFEVINAGVRGYTTYQELEFLKIYGLGMQPDLVLLGFVFNDLFHKYLHRPTERKQLDLEPGSALNRLDPESLPGLVFGRSYLVHYGMHLVEEAVRAVRGEDAFAFDSRPDFFLAWQGHAWRKTAELIGEMKTILADRGVPLAIAVFPVSEQVDPGVRKIDEAHVLYPVRRIMEICRRHRLQCFDLTDALLRKGGRELYVDYLHLNNQGNDVVADELSGFLTQLLTSSAPAISEAGREQRTR